MRYLKVLGLVAVGGVALTAFFAAGSASATVLCKKSMTSGCAAAGEAYGAGTVFHADVEDHGIFIGLWTDITCTDSTIEGKITNAGSSTSTTVGVIETLTFEDCGCAGSDHGSAHITVLTLGSLEIHHISSTDNGTITGKDTVLTINCTSLGTQCRFGTGAGIDVGTLTGGSMATADIDATAPWSSGTGDEGQFLCGSNTAWELGYTFTKPEPLYVAAS